MRVNAQLELESKSAGGHPDGSLPTSFVPYRSLFLIRFSSPDVPGSKVAVSPATTHGFAASLSAWAFILSPLDLELTPNYRLLLLF